MSRRMSWNTLLRRVPVSEPPPDNAENVVPFRRQSLDEMEARLRDLQNAVVDKGIAVERAVMAYNSARVELEEERQKFADRLKESGARVEYPIQFPEADLTGASDGEAV